MDDDAILALVARLARPTNAGGQVIERAAIMAAGSDSQAIVAWILDHGGEPEQSAPKARNRGLHGARLADPDREPRTPQRFVMPAGVL